MHLLQNSPFEQRQKSELELQFQLWTLWVTGWYIRLLRDEVLAEWSSEGGASVWPFLIIKPPNL